VREVLRLVHVGSSGERPLKWGPVEKLNVVCDNEVTTWWVTPRRHP
jgi:hypothetical protein